MGEVGAGEGDYFTKKATLMQRSQGEDNIDELRGHLGLENRVR